MGIEGLFRAESAVPLTRLRVLLGLLFAGSAARFLAKGWIIPLYVEPLYRFPYPGFGWVPEPGEAGLVALFLTILVAGVAIAAGLAYRLAAVALFLAFTWVELIDAATWLNHYYLMSLLAGMLVLLPLHRHASLDAVLGRVRPSSVHPRWMRGWVQAQVAVVYFFAGVAKVNSDWLLRGEPLATWLRNLGIDVPGLAIGMSWAGLAYDLTIPLWLAWRPARLWAFLAVVGFHATVGILFPIGVFPLLMIVLATVFFPGPRVGARAVVRAPVVAGVAVVWMLVQVTLPLRHVAYGKDVNWTEEGFRFSWRVMLVNKAGYVEYRLVERETGRTWRVSPREDLSPMQLEQMATQGEMIVQYGRSLAERFRARGHDVAVFAESYVSWNGRLSARYVNPEVDLTRDPLPKEWILAAPGDAPILTR